MTFTQTIKSEILKIKNDKKCCRRSMLYGMLLFSSWFEEGKIGFSSENKELCEKAKKLLEEFAGADNVQFYTTNGQEHTEYRVNILSNDAKADEVFLRSFGYTNGNTTYKILLENFECDLCKAAFLRGAFLACASTASPESAYHMEFVVSRFNLSRELLRLLKICGFTAKYTKRNSHYVVYFKESEAIVDLIALIGAVNCSFDMTNSIIEKNIRNNCNRVANCEAANIKRTVSTAQKQIDAIRSLMDSGRFALLSDELRETALLRLENDDVSLAELSLLHNVPVTKSCVNHRLTKICDIWESEKNKKEPEV